MASINTSKMLVAGVAAGVFLFLVDGVVNGVILADQWAAYQKSLGKTGEFSAAQMGIFAVLDLVVGLLLAWMYAAIRPRFGAGAGTAIRVGVVGWLLSGLIPNSFLIASGVLPVGLMSAVIGIALVQSVVAFALRANASAAVLASRGSSFGPTGGSRLAISAQAAR